MFGFNKNKTINYPAEVVTTLDDLMRFQYLVQSRKLLSQHPVYSILAGNHASKMRGRGLDFEEVRIYVPGDDIRNIDWRVTARTDNIFSKVFNEEKERPSFTILDQSSWLFFGSTRFVKSVSAAHAAALSIFYTLKRGDRAGGIIFNEEGSDYIAPRRSKGAAQYYLQCAINRNKELPKRKKVQPNTAILNKVLYEAASTITHDYVVTIISDFSAIDDHTKELLKNLSYHNDVILVHIYDPFEISLPDGKLVLTDGKHQIRWNNNKHHWQKKYSDNYSEMRSKLASEFMFAGIPVVFFSTETSIENQVMEDIGKIKKSKAKTG